MRLAILASIPLALATSAEAQWNTNCSTIGNYTNCQTRAPQAPYQMPKIQQFDAMAAIRAAEAGRAMRQQREAANLLPEPQQDARLMDMRRHAGGLINEGKCDEALSYMLTNGELGLASEVKLLCQK